MCIYNLRIQFLAQYDLLDSALEDPFHMETESIEIAYIENIVHGIEKDNKRLKKSVQDFYENLLKPVEELIVPCDLPTETKKRLRRCFEDIYWCLKVHVIFYRRIDKRLTKTEVKVSNLSIPSPKQTEQIQKQEGSVHPESKASKKKSGIKRTTDDCIDEILSKVGYLGGLTDEEMILTEKEMKDLPNHDLFEKLIDPGSKLLEMFSVVAASPEGTPEEESIQAGSKDHANLVLEMARSFLLTLRDTNTFLPKVLAKVSREENSSIGASMAVSYYLRPIFLYNRVVNYKKSLGEAIITFRTLDNFDKLNLEFEAFDRQTVEIPEKEEEREEEKKKKSNNDEKKSSVSQKKTTKRYVDSKDICQNCEMIFRGNDSGKGGPSFLGACAEYCPVDELLHEKPKLKDLRDDPVIDHLLTRNRSRCSLLFKELESIYERCKYAVDSQNNETKKDLYWEVIHKLYIFGLKPQCNPYF